MRGARRREPSTRDGRTRTRGAARGRRPAVPEQGFAGRYRIRYFHENGEFSDEYDLEIERAGDCYDVRWLADGVIGAVGVGMEVGDRLAVGWRRVAD